MEKYGQFRDKGSGIAPFLPVPAQPRNPLFLPAHLLLFCIRIPLVTFAWFVWLTIVQWTPAGGILRKANLWCVLGIPGVWWIDLQVDGVKRGSLSQAPRGRIPQPSQIIASSCTSPLDILYLAAIFDPIFTVGEADSRLVRAVSLEVALAACFEIHPPPPFNSQQASSMTLTQLAKENPTRVIVTFPESTTSNGRGILTLSPSLLSAKSDTKLFPVSLRYTPADIVTPLPGWLEATSFIWRLNSRPTHCIRVRIGAPTTLSSYSAGTAASNDKPKTYASGRDPGGRASTGPRGYEANFFDTLDSSTIDEDGLLNGGSPGHPIEEYSEQERKLLNAVADTLARLGRVKRVSLGVEEKQGFVEAWRRRGKYR